MLIQRTRKYPAYLNCYYKKVDLRKVVKRKKFVKKKQVISKMLSIAEYLEWWESVKRNITAKMDHSRMSNFSFLMRILCLQLNSRYYGTETHSWRFTDLSNIIAYLETKVGNIVNNLHFFNSAKTV